jgi:hypothetical protein
MNRFLKELSMNLRRLFAALVVSAFPAMASAQNVTLAHGIPGGDLGLEPSLPVDVCAGGSPVLAGVPFGATAALSLDPGVYALEIRLADASGPCQGALAIPVSFALSVAENVVILAHLSEQGTPTFSKFVNDLQPLADDRGRVVVRHAAAAPPVRVLLKGRSPRLIRELRNPGQSVSAEVRAGTYNASIFPAAGGGRVLGPAPLVIDAGQAVFLHAVGSARTGSLTVIPVVISVP